MVLMSKRGITLREGLQAVVIIGLIGLFMGFFALFNDRVAVTDLTTSTVVNETFSTLSNVTGTSASNVDECGFTSFSVVAAINATNGVAINTANYSVNSDSGTITSTEGTCPGAFCGYDWNVTYTYQSAGSTCTIAQNMNTEFENQVDILGLVLLAVFFGIAITALLASFLIGRRRV
jgi:hypothetical protein